jgi:hypothetical protein
MPHVDELLGVATVASAGLFAAIALQPIVDGASDAGARGYGSASLFAVAIAPIGKAMDKSEPRAQPTHLKGDNR